MVLSLRSPHAWSQLEATAAKGPSGALFNRPQQVIVLSLPSAQVYHSPALTAPNSPAGASAWPSKL